MKAKGADGGKGAHKGEGAQRGKRAHRCNAQVSFSEIEWLLTVSKTICFSLPL